VRQSSYILNFLDLASSFSSIHRLVKKNEKSVCTCVTLSRFFSPPAQLFGLENGKERVEEPTLAVLRVNFPVGYFSLLSSFLLFCCLNHKNSKSRWRGNFYIGSQMAEGICISLSFFQPSLACVFVFGKKKFFLQVYYLSLGIIHNENKIRGLESCSWT